MTKGSIVGFWEISLTMGSYWTGMAVNLDFCVCGGGRICVTVWSSSAALKTHRDNKTLRCGTPRQDSYGQD